MNFISQKINGLFLIIPDLHIDERGVFRRSFCKEVFKKNGVDFNVLQGNISENFNKLTMNYTERTKELSRMVVGFLVVTIT